MIFAIVCACVLEYTVCTNNYSLDTTEQGDFNKIKVTRQVFDNVMQLFQYL